MSKIPLRLLISLCGVLAGTADPVFGQDGLSLHWPRNQKQTAGVELKLAEVKRSTGRRGTQITYRIESNGFPRDKTYKVQISSLSSPKPTTLVTSIEVSETGALTVGRFQNQPQELSQVNLTIEDFNKGEFYMIEVVNEDGTVYARDRVHPFPIEARDGECRVFAELVTKDRKNFLISGIGFGPSTDVRIRSSEDDGKDTKSGTQRVSSDGTFVLVVAHRRRGGVGTFVAAGATCEVTMRYEFGRQAKGPL